MTKNPLRHVALIRHLDFVIQHSFSGG